jgi:pilus assembly protein Flp/PilA
VRGKIIVRILRDLRLNEKGVTMIEYALIAGLVSIVAVSLLSAMGGKLKNLFTTVNSALTTA